MRRYKHTPGDWSVFIDDSGDEDRGFPISISVDDELSDDTITIVRPGGFHPYEWDIKIPQREHVANAQLMADSPKLLNLLDKLEPYLDQLICYASTPEEFEPNKLIKEVQEILKKHSYDKSS